MTLGRKLRELRLAAEKTLEQQAKIHCVSITDLNNWEEDLEVPSALKMQEFVDYYDIPEDWLLSRDKTTAIPLSAGDWQLLNMVRPMSDNTKREVISYMECLYDEQSTDTA